MNYSVLAGGKRLRPMLMLETYRLFGGISKDIYPFMTAIECLHTYSLVHDDLPSMDNDDYRRGKLTCHKQFGEATAVLCGDALLNLAFEQCLKSIKDEGTLKAARLFGEYAGVGGMITGQAFDLENEKTQ